MKKLGLVIVALVLACNTTLSSQAKKNKNKDGDAQLVGFETMSCKKIAIQSNASITVCVEANKPGLDLDREVSYQIQKAATMLAKNSRGKGIKKMNVPDTSGYNFICAGGDPDGDSGANNPTPDPEQECQQMYGMSCADYNNMMNNPCYMDPQSSPSCPGYVAPDPDQYCYQMYGMSCADYQSMMNSGMGD